MKKTHVSPINKCIKTISVPGDKSISHRAVIIGSLAKGMTKIKNFLEAEDTLNTINIYRNLGINIEKKKYLIVPTKRKALSWVNASGQRITVKSVMHPGMNARPFFWNALQKKQAAVKKEMEDGIQEIIRHTRFRDTDG